MSEQKTPATEIELPEGVEAKLDSTLLTIKGGRGENKRNIRDPRLELKVEQGKITIGTKKASKREKKTVNTYTAHIKNMIKGANEGHEYVLKVCSSHFPMNVAVNNNQLVIKNFIGEKHPRTLSLKDGVDVKVDGDKIIVSSSSKELAGTTASDIEKLTKRPGFDMRIFQDGIYMINKDGKELK